MTNDEYAPCKSEQCDRQVRLAVAFCCNPCANAWEATPRYEPHAHTADCDGRHAERGPSNIWERT